MVGENWSGVGVWWRVRGVGGGDDVDGWGTLV